MTEYKLFTFLGIMLGINIVLFLFQGAVAAENPSASYVDLSNSPTGNLVSDGDVNSSFDWSTIEGNEEAYNDFSSSSEALQQQGSSFWGIVSGIFTQPAGFMRQAGVPDPIRISFSVIWYAFGVALIIGFIRGGSGD